MENYITNIDAANDMIERMQKIIVLQEKDLDKAKELIAKQHELIEMQSIAIKLAEITTKVLASELKDEEPK